MEYKKTYCCNNMEDSKWYIEKEKDGSITLYEDYSVHYIPDAKFCPWCGKELIKIFE